MRIDLFVPEATVIVARMLLQLHEQCVEHGMETRLARPLGNREQRTPRANMVEVVIARLVGNNRVVGPHDGVIIA